MQIHLREITVRELVENYQNSDEEGVYGYNGKLNIWFEKFILNFLID